MREHILRRLAAAPPSSEPRGDHDLSPDLSPPIDATPAAVLLPLIEHPGGLTLVFTERTDHLLDHPGQVAFPGGRAEPDDRDAVATALRETHEEIGLAPERVELAGHLGPYVTGTGFHITPVVGFVRPPVEFTPDPYEVAEVFEVPFAFLLDRVNRKIESTFWKGRERDYYVFDYDGHTIWGVTAGILVGFCDLVSET